LHAAGQWCKSRLHEEQFTWPVIVQKALLLVEETLKTEAKQLETEVIQKPRFKGFEPMKIA
jgi:hypothetical protein